MSTSFTQNFTVTVTVSVAPSQASPSEATVSTVCSAIDSICSESCPSTSAMNIPVGWKIGTDRVRSALIVGPPMSGKKTLIKALRSKSPETDSLHRRVRSGPEVLEFLDCLRSFQGDCYADSKMLHPAWGMALVPNVDAVFVSARWVSGDGLRKILGDDLAKFFLEEAERNPAPEETVAYQFYVLWPATRTVRLVR
jgi:hypothetical protein